jgi:hypothetical protein
MRAFTVNWNPYKDETKINLSPEFKESDWITRADVLQDAIHDLQDLYDKTLGENA